MKRILHVLCFASLFFLSQKINAQSIEFARYILATGTAVDEDSGEEVFISTDDAEQENDEIDSLTDDDIDAGWEGEPDDQNILTAGLRFRNIFIPQGATIDSAFIVVHSHEVKTAEDVARITIYGDATGDAQTFTEDMLITDRPSTEARLTWEVAEPWGLWTPHRTLDLSPIVQEIVDREDWEIGNSIAFILEGENQGPSEVENAREFESYENIADPEDGGDGQNHPERVPRLRVYFQSGATSIFDALTANVKELKLFPNPTNGQVTIELEGDDRAAIRVFNVNGQIFRNIDEIYGSQVQLDLADLTPGVYYVQARQRNEVYLQKLIVK